MTATLEKELALEEILWGLKFAATEQKRTMGVFAHEEIIIPDGKDKDQEFDDTVQPYTRLWFALVDSGLWNRFFATGPTQSGKTLCAFVIPILYHLFEMCENVIVGLPNMDMAYDKWRIDIWPCIKKSRYAVHLPKNRIETAGGAKIMSVDFKNGVILRFMSVAGGDKGVAAFTARVVVMTEIDDFDESTEASKEADRVTQLENRTNSFDESKRIYAECTLSTETGRTNTEIVNGTRTRLVIKCPHCKVYVTPEREHFTGWEDAEDEITARENGSFYCPECGAVWSEEDRLEANLAAVAAHRGQTVGTDGCTIGEAPRTMTLGFRWGAANNMFVSHKGLGSKLWKADRAEDEENAEKELCQFVFAVPHVPDTLELVPLTAEAIQRRTGTLYHGTVPEDALTLMIGIDVHGRYKSDYWVAIAFTPKRVHIVDYGVLEHDSKKTDEAAITNALESFKEHIFDGWAWEGHKENKIPDLIGVDGGWATETVKKFVQDAGVGFWSTKGFGATAFAKTTRQYTEPKKRTPEIRMVGLRWHSVKDKKSKHTSIHFDVDFWKSWIHARLSMDRDEEGAMMLFKSHGDRPGKKGGAHHTFAHHLVAEKEREVLTLLRGMQRIWHTFSKNNHFLDATAIACMLGSMMLRFKAMKTETSQETQKAAMTTPDGRAFSILER